MTISTAATSLDLEVDFRLGDVLVRPHSSTLEVSGEPRRVDYKAMRVLVCLARSAGTEVTKERIFSQVWDAAAVSDDVLTGAVSTLRKALGDNPRSPRYIQTIPRVGYRLIASVEPLTKPASAPAPARSVDDVSARRWLILVLMLVTLILVLALVGWWTGGWWTEPRDRRGPDQPEAATAEAVRSVLTGMELDGLDSGERQQLWKRYEAGGVRGLFRFFLEVTPVEELESSGASAMSNSAMSNSAMSKSELLIGAGEVERGLDWLERAVERREPSVVTLGNYSVFDGVRDLPQL